MSVHTPLSRHSRAWRPTLRTSRNQNRMGVSLVTAAIAAAALVLLVAFVVVCVQSMAADQPPAPGFTAAETVPRGEDVLLPASAFADGKARFYRYLTAAGHETRFFVIKSPDGVVRAALDACDNCFRQRRGFRQVGDHLICNECGGTFSPQHINVLKGGCSPSPLERTVDGDHVVVRAAALEQGASYF